MKDWKYICLLIGTMFGAGFATGKEIYVYFLKFGKICFCGPIIIFIIFSFLIYFLIKYYKNINYNKINNNKLNKLLFFIIYLIFSSSMFSALSLFLKDNLININIIFIYLFLIIFCLIILTKELKYLAIINKIITPIFVLMFIFISLYLIFNSNTSLYNFKSDLLFIPTSLIYIASNLLLLKTIIENIATKIQSPKKVSIISSLIYSIIVLLGIFTLYKNPQFLLLDMPFIELVKGSKLLTLCFNFVFLSAIITSLISFIYATKENFIFNIKSKYKNILCVLFVFFISLLGFSNIVSKLYFLIGVIGILYFLNVILSFKFCFNFTNCKVHKTRKYTKNNYTSHN